MPDPINPPAGGSKHNDKKQKGKSKGDDQPAAVGEPVSKPRPPSTDAEGVVGQALKEQEPAVSPDRVLAQIQEKEKEAALDAEKKVREELGEEARLREPEPQIPPDVADSGVISPEQEASETLAKGATIELALTEEEYKEGQHTKLTAKVTQKREVYGVKSIIALAIAVGKLIKMARHHMKKVVFRKESD